MEKSAFLETKQKEVDESVDRMQAEMESELKNLSKNPEAKQLSQENSRQEE